MSVALGRCCRQVFTALFLAEVRKVFATNMSRDLLFSGFAHGFAELRAAGAKNVYLDGSFVTGKTLPKDFDCCWEIAGVDLAKLDPVFFLLKSVPFISFNNVFNISAAKSCNHLI